MIGYHGSETEIATIHGSTGGGIYLATEYADAVTYAPIVHTIVISDDATIADWRDIDEAVEAVHEAANFTPADYNSWELMEITEVRDWLDANGFDGARLDDTTPNGDPHEAVLVWNVNLLTITDITKES